MSKSNAEKANRRDFMKAAIVAISGFIGGTIGISAIPYIIGPAQKGDNEDWVRLGAVSKVEINVPTLFKATIETQTGWINAEEEFSAYVLTENGQEFSVMSNICTHLGCRVRWIPDEENFFCPCHNAVFARNGTVVAGPPPRPLDQFEHKVEDGFIFVRRG